MTPSRLRANLAAKRWQRCGSAIVMHTGQLTRDERWHAALINAGPNCLLTAFTAAELYGLRGWERAKIHVLGPRGTNLSSTHRLPIRLHRTRDWPAKRRHDVRCHQLAPALLLAAATFDGPRPGCGLLAAAVQQRLVTVAELRVELIGAVRLRHRADLTLAVEDIAGGSDALSEIDFVRLCRRHQLPLPEQQKVRRDSHGRRRYLDATWRRQDGRLVVAEIDGAVHLSPRRWWDDQLRQNELALAEALILRFPSVVVRTQPAVVATQLRRALLLP